MIGTTGDSFPIWLGYLPYVAWMKLSQGQTKMDAFSEIHRTSPWKCLLSEWWIETDLVRSNESHSHQHVQQSCGCISALWQERLVQTMTSNKNNNNNRRSGKSLVKSSAMSPLLQWPLVKFQDGGIDWRNRSECKNHGLLEILHDIYSPDHHWIPGNLTFSIFIKNPSAHSCHPVSLTIVLFNISANPHALNIIKHIGGGLFSIHLSVAIFRPLARTMVFPHKPCRLQILQSQKQRNGQHGRRFSQGDLLHPLFELAISLLLGSAGGQGGLHLWEEPLRLKLSHLGHQSACCNQLASFPWCAHLVGNISISYQLYPSDIYSSMMSPRCNIVNITYVLLFVSIRGQMSRVYNDILVRKQ